jgi:hypothetical protein
MTWVYWRCVICYACDIGNASNIGDSWLHSPLVTKRLSGRPHRYKGNVYHHVMTAFFTSNVRTLHVNSIRDILLISYLRKTYSK